MSTDELRQRFLEFFASKGHKIYPSDTLVPQDDPTLLFTSAGMNQFKQEFLGKPTEFKRRATCQKCLRTDDLDKVGKTISHHTFFEMLGNFSFGDYFKEEAIGFAWEFVTEKLHLPQERLWASVYKEDGESYKIWKDKIKLPKDRIVKLGAKENFWPSNAPQEGPNGPCGPCAEIFYDHGKNFGCGRPDCKPGCECGRFVEVWNLVFTQFDRKGKNELVPLPNKNIDTGMGLERMAAVLQGVTNNFEIDIFRPITQEIVCLSTLESDRLDCAQYSARNAIADHIRAVTFAIADGILPSNDQRGYVIRKLIRRAVWHGRALDIKKTFLHKIVPVVCAEMKAAYPQLEERKEEIIGIVLAEEKRFHKTLERAMSFAKDIIARLSAQRKSKIPGDIAFRLYDTYGLPLEELQNIVGAKNFQLDKEGFEKELELQRKSSRESASFAGSVFVATLAARHKLKPTKFVGAKVYAVKTKIVALFKDDCPINEAKEGDNIKIVLESTPFYGESGGQVGDTGVIKNRDAKIEVSDTQKSEQTIVHLGKIVKGIVKVDDRVEAEIDIDRRRAIACNHTATHLLQAALRKVLGTHVRQAGSWVGPDRLRFDFTHFQALNQRQLRQVEELVNSEINQKKKAQVLEMGFEEAQKMGALAFFGEKYQEKVRVLKIGDVSLELCGGTHVLSCGEIEKFKIIGESSVASGIRRIEAVTADRAEELLKQKQDELRELADEFSTTQDKLPGSIEEFSGKMKLLDRRLEKSRLDSFKSKIDEVISGAKDVSGIKIVAREIKSADMRLLRLMVDLLKEKLRPSVVVLASVWEEKAFLVCALSAQLRSKGLDAGKIISLAAKEVDGTGGGRADFAQAGGKNPKGIKKALEKAKEIIKEELERQ